jgi:hypothetical protein
MDIPFDRFKKINTESSITTSDTRPRGPMDVNTPYSFLEWLIQSNLDLGSPENHIQQYSTYIRSWMSKTGSNTTTERDLIIDTYKSLLKQITLKYTTLEEKRYLSNIDFNNPADLDAVIPFYATRLKDIVVFLSKKREEVKFQKIKFNLFGTNEGVEKLIYNLVLQLTNTEEFILDHMQTMPSLSDLSANLSIEIEELYDIHDEYFNINPCESDDILSAIQYDPVVFINFEEAISKLSADFGTLIQTGSAFNIFTGSDTALSVVSDSSDVDIENFPDSEFFDYIKSKDNLKINLQKKFIESIQGSNTFYLSSGPGIVDNTGQTIISYVTGQSTTANNEILNYYNREYPTIAHVPYKTKLASKKTIGGYFTPQNLGITNYHSIDPLLFIDESLIQENTVQEYPDPSKYGTKQAIFINHAENIRWVMADKGNDSKAGDIVNSNRLQKFYNYQSTIEVNKYSQAGISRVDDNTDFWTSSQDWNNEDVYIQNRSNYFDLSARQEDLLVNRGSVFKLCTDIYGNTYGLFKDIQPLPQASLTGRYTNIGDDIINIDYTCVYMDGSDFIDVITGTEPVVDSYAEGRTFIITLQHEHVSFGAYFMSNYCDSIETSTEYNCRIFDAEEPPNNFITNTASIQVETNALNGWNNTPILSTWDARKFLTAVDCYNTAPRIINYSVIEVGLLSAHTRGDEYATQLQAHHSPATTKHTIYSQQNDLPGRLFVRNINNTIIEPASSALSNIYAKYYSAEVTTGYYNTIIRDELDNNLLDIDVVHDTLILRTRNFIIFEKITYNYTTNTFESNNMSVYAQTGNFDEHFNPLYNASDERYNIIKPFFNERTNKIYTGTMAVSGEVGWLNWYTWFETGDTPLIYPEIYEYDTNTFKLRRVFPDYEEEGTPLQRKAQLKSSVTIEDDLTDFYLPGDILSADEDDMRITNVDTPILTYNEVIDKYYLINTYTLSSSLQKDVFSICKTEFSLNNNKFTSNGSLLFFPTASSSSAEIISDNYETVYLNSTETSTSLTNISGYNLHLTIDPGTLALDYKHLKIIYNFNDGSDIQVVSRNVVDDLAKVTLDNFSDITTPTAVPVTHTYYFTGSADETVQAQISAVDYNFNTTVFTIDIERKAYTVASAFESMKVIDAKSYINNNQENTILTLESQNPQYITHVSLSGKQFNSKIFNY